MGGGRGAPIYQGYRTLYKTYVVPFDKDLYLLARTKKNFFSWGGGARIRGAHQKWGVGGGAPAPGGPHSYATVWEKTLDSKDYGYDMTKDMYMYMHMYI